MTGVQDVDWLAIGPVLGPAVAALAVLVLDAVIGSGRTGARRALDLLAVAGLVAGLALVAPLERPTARRSARRPASAPTSSRR
jgi:hypothetical protein